MIRRCIALAAVPLIAGLGVAAAAPASASTGHRSDHRSLLSFAAKIKPQAATPTSGTCNLVPPATARIGAFITEIPVQVSGDCASQAGLKAIWYTGPSLNYSTDSITVEAPERPAWYLFSDAQLGTRTWNGWVAVDGNNRVYAQNSPTTTVKVVSYAGLHTYRSGGKTTINTRVIRYATSLDKTIPYVGETGVIQYRPVGGSTWVGLKNATSNSQGLYSYSYTYTTSQAREYRVAFKESTYIWGSVSPTRTS